MLARMKSLVEQFWPPGLTFDTTALVHNETKPITKTIEKDVAVKFINGWAKQ